MAFESKRLKTTGLILFWTPFTFISSFSPVPQNHTGLERHDSRRCYDNKTTFIILKIYLGTWHYFILIYCICLIPLIVCMQIGIQPLFHFWVFQLVLCCTTDLCTCSRVLLYLLFPAPPRINSDNHWSLLSVSALECS